MVFGIKVGLSGGRQTEHRPRVQVNYVIKVCKMNQMSQMIGHFRSNCIVSFWSVAEKIQPSLSLPVLISDAPSILHRDHRYA